jgi:hypothetical protein
LPDPPVNTDAGGFYLQSITFDNPNPVANAFSLNPNGMTLSRGAGTPTDVTVTAVPTPAGSYNYQWYLDGTVITGETNDSIIITGSNYYHNLVPGVLHTCKCHYHIRKPSWVM